MLEIVRYSSELNPAEKFFGEIHEHVVDPEMVDIAGQIIERKSAAFEREAVPVASLLPGRYVR